MILGPGRPLKLDRRVVVLVLPARTTGPSDGGSVPADWREVLGNRPFLAFALAMVGMFTLESQLYLLLPDGARQATGWDGAAGLVLGWPFAVLAVWLVVAGLLARRAFRWTA